MTATLGCTHKLRYPKVPDSPVGSWPAVKALGFDNRERDGLSVQLLELLGQCRIMLDDEVERWPLGGSITTLKPKFRQASGLVVKPARDLELLPRWVGLVLRLYNDPPE